MDFSVEWISEEKSFGVIAARDFAQGDVVMEEKPIVCCQYLYNKHFFPACSHCLRSLEAPEEMLNRLAGLQGDAKTQLPMLGYSAHCDQDATTGTTETVERYPCHECGEREIYCSESCRREAWQQYHATLCLGTNPMETHPLLLLEDIWRKWNPPPETSTIMLVARMVAMILQAMDRGTGAEEARSVFDRLASTCYNEHLDVLHRLFEGELNERMEMTQQLFQQAFPDPRVHDEIGSEGFRKLLCAMALNGQGIGTSSLDDFQRYLRKLGTEQADGVLDQIESLEDAIEEVSGMFTAAEGSGLYALHSKLNHSCEPNAIVQFPYNSATLQVTASRPVRKGEEICIDYLSDMCCFDDGEEGDDNEEDMHCDYHDDDDDDSGDISEEEEDMEMEAEPQWNEHIARERRDMLKKNYLFDCSCPRHASESGR